VNTKIDQGKKKEASLNTARNKFMQMDTRNQASNADVDLPSTHQNTITLARPFTTSGQQVTHFSTTGVDGQLVIWDLLSSGVANLRI
jgi:actin related protein 2/3 complex subunit 1A/1B